MSVYSSLALVTSVVFYLLALFAHAAEWAAARGTRVTTDATADATAEASVSASVSDRELVAVGAQGGATTTTTRTTATAHATDAAPDAVETDRSRQRVEMFGRLGVVLTGMGLALALTGVVLRGVAGQRAPWGNMYEFVTSAMVFIVAAYLVLVAVWGMRWLGLMVAGLAAVGNGLAVTVFYVDVGPLVPALHSVWFLIHIVAAALSGAAFNIGGLASILYLIKRRREQRTDVLTPSYLDRLPTARRLDLIAYRFHAFAFPLWTFTVAAGAIWAEYAWGRFWGWDPKETWALVTWVIYACYLHARATAGWRGVAAASIAIVGLVSFWFNFIGVNLLFTGFHSYAGI